MTNTIEIVAHETVHAASRVLGAAMRDVDVSLVAQSRHGQLDPFGWCRRGSPGIIQIPTLAPHPDTNTGPARDAPGPEGPNGMEQSPRHEFCGPDGRAQRQPYSFNKYKRILAAEDADVQENDLRRWFLMSMVSVETDYENLSGDFADWRILEAREEE